MTWFPSCLFFVWPHYAPTSLVMILVTPVIPPSLCCWPSRTQFSTWLLQSRALGGRSNSSSSHLFWFLLPTAAVYIMISVCSFCPAHGCHQGKIIPTFRRVPKRQKPIFSATSLPSPAPVSLSAVITIGFFGGLVRTNKVPPHR